MKKVLILFLLVNNLSAQVLKGIVVDAQTYEPLPFANILLLDSNLGTTTNEDGEFTLHIRSALDKIRVSYVGYSQSIVSLSNVDLKVEIVILMESIDISLQEVTVFSRKIYSGSNIQSNALSMQSEQIREISSAMPDILRSIQSLPGVVVNNEFKADFNVRGGNQDENLVLVNGTRVYEPYHIKEASNASVGIFNVDLISNVNLITGGFSAKYGDKMSSVLDINYREGNKEAYSGAVSLSLAYLDGYLEGPISDKSSFILGFRKSYMEYVLSLIDYEDISTAKPSFYDVQGVFSYSLTPRNKLLLEFIHAGDAFSYTPERLYSNKSEKENNQASYFSSLLDVKSKNILSSKALLNFEISYYDQIDEEDRLFDRDARISVNEFDNIHTTRKTYDSLRIKTLNLKTDLQYQITPNFEAQFGFSYKNISYKQNYNDTWTFISKDTDSSPFIADTVTRTGLFGSDIPIDLNSFKYSSYLENIFSISKNLTFNLGGRIDYFDINQHLTFSPRLNAAYLFEDGTAVKLAWGRFYQSPSYHQLAYSETSDSNTKSQYATHYILSIEKLLSFSENYFLKLRTELFSKQYNDLISSQFGVFERLTYSKQNDATGYARGFDIYLVLSYKNFYGWLSYGYLDAMENVKDKNSSIFGEHPRYTNQTHTVSVITNFDLGENWELSLKGYFGSGFPYTPKFAVQNEQTGLWNWVDGEIHSKNLPAYKRLDFRVSKLFDIGELKLDMFLDISNVLNFENVVRYEYNPSSFTKPVAEEILLWPIVPSFGIRLEF